MSNKFIYAIKDEKVGQFIQPFFEINDIQMARSLAQVVKDPKNTLSIYAQDFSVYKIGSFDTELGLIDHKPIHVLNLLTLKEIQNAT